MPVPSHTLRNVERALKDLESWRSDGYRVVVVHAGHGPAQRMVEALGEAEVPARLVGAADRGARVGRLSWIAWLIRRSPPRSPCGAR